LSVLPPTKFSTAWGTDRVKVSDEDLRDAIRKIVAETKQQIVSFEALVRVLRANFVVSRTRIEAAMSSLGVALPIAARTHFPGPAVSSGQRLLKIPSRGEERREAFVFNESMSLAEIAELLLLEERRRPAADLRAGDVPSHKGVYVCFRGPELMWIGKATGQRGLSGRIIGQHLNEHYLDRRPTRFFSDNVLVLPNGKPAVDSSYLRRKLGRIPSLNLSPGPGTVAYIRENMSVAWVTFSPECDKTLIPWVERGLINMLKPTLNG